MRSSRRHNGNVCFQPAIKCNVRAKMEIAQEVIFGPALALLACDVTNLSVAEGGF
jgi:acyl-CoA reductase-like NAD-dependent aldehyde dehydrogenase